MYVHCKFFVIGLFCLCLCYEAVIFLDPLGAIVTQMLNNIPNVPPWSYWSWQFSAKILEGFKISDL